MAAGFRAVTFFAATFFLAAGFRAVTFFAATFFLAAGFRAVAFFAAGFLAAGFMVDAFAMAWAAAVRAFSAARSSLAAALISFIIFWNWAADIHLIAVDILTLEAVLRTDLVFLAMF